jgi:hypothetical protein
MMIAGRAGRLHQENILPADVLLDLHERFAIGKRFDGRFADLGADVSANGLGQGPVRRAGKNLHNEFIITLKRSHRDGGEKGGLTIPATLARARRITREIMNYERGRDGGNSGFVIFSMRQAIDYGSPSLAF